MKYINLSQRFAHRKDAAFAHRVCVFQGRLYVSLYSLVVSIDSTWSDWQALSLPDAMEGMIIVGATNTHLFLVGTNKNLGLAYLYAYDGTTVEVIRTTAEDNTNLYITTPAMGDYRTYRPSIMYTDPVILDDGRVMMQRLTTWYSGGLATTLKVELPIAFTADLSSFSTYTHSYDDQTKEYVGDTNINTNWNFAGNGVGTAVRAPDGTLHLLNAGHVGNGNGFGSSTSMFNYQYNFMSYKHVGGNQWRACPTDSPALAWDYTWLYWDDGANYWNPSGKIVAAWPENGYLYVLTSAGRLYRWASGGTHWLYQGFINHPGNITKSLAAYSNVIFNGLVKTSRGYLVEIDNEVYHYSDLFQAPTRLTEPSSWVPKWPFQHPVTGAYVPQGGGGHVRCWSFVVRSMRDEYQMGYTNGLHTGYLNAVEFGGHVVAMGKLHNVSSTFSAFNDQDDWALILPYTDNDTLFPFELAKTNFWTGFKKTRAM